MRIAPQSAIDRDMRRIRHQIHAHPETAFTEVETAALVAEQLRSFGLEVETGVAQTGVVGTLRGSVGQGSRVIGLRADLDGLSLQEENQVPYRSVIPGKMHACGHDGHTSMLLGAAQYLAQGRERLDGTVHFIFQPAEENEAGARVMVEAGLFTRFPMQCVFALHNWPGLAAGQLALRPGPIMAACDTFSIRLRAAGTHAAMPHRGRDVMLLLAQVIQGLHAIAREVDPMEPHVLTITQVHGGHAYNVLPECVELKGCVRTFSDATQDHIEQAMARVLSGLTAACGGGYALDYDRRYPVTRNYPQETAFATTVARELLGAERVRTDLPPSSGSEDFAYMLQQVPGCYAWLGNGSDAEGRGLHSPRYDFNDDILAVGASYFVALAERYLERQAA